MNIINLFGTAQKHNPKLWLTDYKRTYGVKGLATLAYWSGSFYADQIRESQQSFPFLELSGDAGSGRSSLLNFLWKLRGVNNHEGVDFSRCTSAGRARLIHQPDSIPLILVGVNSSDQKGTFDWSELSGLYNGDGVRTTSSSLEVIRPKFKGVLIAAQDEPIDAHSHVMQRIIRIHWDKSHFSTQSQRSFFRLHKFSMEQLRGFMSACTSDESLFLNEYHTGYDAALEQLSRHPKISNHRLMHNHAQVMGLAYALKAIRVLDGLLRRDVEDVNNYLLQCCIDRHDYVKTGGAA